MPTGAPSWPVVASDLTLDSDSSLHISVESWCECACVQMADIGGFEATAECVPGRWTPDDLDDDIYSIFEFAYTACPELAEACFQTSCGEELAAAIMSGSGPPSDGSVDMMELVSCVAAYEDAHGGGDDCEEILGEMQCGEAGCYWSAYSYQCSTPCDQFVDGSSCPSHMCSWDGASCSTQCEHISDES